MKKLLTFVIMIFFIGVSVIQVSASDFHSVYGYVYIGGNPAPSGTRLQRRLHQGKAC